MISNKLSRRGFFGALGGAVVGDGTVREHWPVVAPQDVAPLSVLHRDYNLTVRRRAVGGQFTS